MHAIRHVVLRLAPVLALLAPLPALSQAPSDTWRTFRTEHFHVHFTPDIEDAARRVAAHAESAYGQLARHLHPPRGPIDLVVADNVDFTNGYATVFPNNRIVVYTSPSITESALRFTDDPLRLVVTHELAHTFQLDRTGGIWRVLQSVFGRMPMFFPNGYKPSWLLEGQAVHYETLLTGTGRVAGSEHRMIARTAALSHTIPRLDQLSLANPRYPYAYHTYAYGSLFMDWLARTHGDSSLRVFVESSARQLIPWYLNGPSRRAFGRSFTAAYQAWAASLQRDLPDYSPPIAGWRDLTREGAYATFPRWANDSTLIYSGTGGRETYGAWALTIPATLTRPDAARDAGDDARDRVRRRRMGRRHTESPNSVLADGSLLYSQLEYVSPYHLRGDLYIDHARGGTTRITHGARLATPDARRDSLIVAVQTVPAGTRLVLVSADGSTVAPITTGGPEEHWLEPRWSPDGRHIAAIRWLRGATSQVVVLDTMGRVVQTIVSERALNATPSWSADGRWVYFSSDRDGVSNLYRAAFRAAFPDSVYPRALVRVSDAQTGLFEPQPTPGDAALAAVVFRADGYHVGIAPLDSVRVASAPDLETVQPQPAAPITPVDAPARAYSPWRSLLPRYWMPVWGAALEANSARIGAYTNSYDAIRRHEYQAMLLVPTDGSGLTGLVGYRYAGLSRPVVELFASQEWENYRRILDASNGNAPIGMLRRRIRDASLGFIFERPRVRNFGVLSLSAGLEVRDYAADSTPLMARVDSAFQRVHHFPRVALTLGWSNTQRPAHAFSPEDGITLSTTGRWRWLVNDSTTGTLSVVSAASAFKSLDLPGYAHHVLALRGAAGYVDSRGTGYLEVGGLSGDFVDVLPGYAMGEGRRTFGVRGFPEATLLGMRAFVGNVEYRAPFSMTARGLGVLPVFFGRTSLTFFGDVGSAWCPSIFPARPAPATALCTQADHDFGFVSADVTLIGSTGVEFNADAALFSWDEPVRWRFGAVLPVLNPGLARSEQRWGAYLTAGVSF